jgi:hypothetical protein
MGRRYALTALSAFQQAKDGSYAFDFYAGLPEGTLYPNDVLNSFFSEFAEEEPEQAIAAAKALAAAHDDFTDRDLDYALYLVAMSVGVEQPEYVAKIISQISSPEEKNDAWRVYYRELFERDAGKAVSRFKEMERPELVALLGSVRSSSFQTSLITGVGERDSEFLYEVVREIPISDSKQALFGETVQVLSQEKPELATSLIAAMPEGALKKELQGKYLETLAASNPEEALVDFSQLPVGEFREQAFQELGKQVTEKERAEVLALANGLAPADREPFLATALPHLISENSVAIAQAMKEGKLDLQPELEGTVIGELAKQLSQDDAAYSREWFEDLPPDLQPLAMRGRAEAMLQLDPEGLVETLETMPRNESWANGVKVLISDLREADPTTAEAWQEALKEEGFAK